MSLCELTLPSMGLILLLYMTLATLDVLAQQFEVQPAWIFVQRSLVVSALLLIVTMASFGLSPFFAMRLPWKYLLTLAFLPWFLVWKIWVCFRGRPGEWVRTEREMNVIPPSPRSTSSDNTGKGER